MGSALEQIPKVESALLTIAAETGEVKVMVGGRDFANSQFKPGRSIPAPARISL